MKSKIQNIDFHIFLSKRFSDFSQSSCSRNQNIFFFFVNIVFSQMFTINAKTYLDMLFLNFCGYWSRVGSRAKKVIIFNLVISLVPYDKISWIRWWYLWCQSFLHFAERIWNLQIQSFTITGKYYVNWNGRTKNVWNVALCVVVAPMLPAHRHAPPPKPHLHSEKDEEIHFH